MIQSLCTTSRRLRHEFLLKRHDGHKGPFHRDCFYVTGILVSSSSRTWDSYLHPFLYLTSVLAGREFLKGWIGSYFFGPASKDVRWIHHVFMKVLSPSRLFIRKRKSAAAVKKKKRTFMWWILCSRDERREQSFRAWVEQRLKTKNSCAVCSLLDHVILSSSFPFFIIWSSSS